MDLLIRLRFGAEIQESEGFDFDKVAIAAYVIALECQANANILLILI